MREGAVVLLTLRQADGKTLNLESTFSDLVNQAYALSPAEIALTLQSARPRMPIPPPPI